MKRIELFFMVLRVPVDYISLLLAGVAAYFLRFQTLAEIRPVIFSLPFDEFLHLATLISALWVILFAFSGLYSPQSGRGFGGELRKIILASSTGSAIMLAVLFFSRELFSSRFIFLVAWAFAIIFPMIGRLWVRFVESSMYRVGVVRKRVVIIGGTSAAKALAADFRAHRGRGIIVLLELPTWNAESRTKVEKLKQLDDIYCMVNLAKRESENLLTFATEHQLTIIYSADLFSTQSANLAFFTAAGVPLIAARRTKLDGWGSVYKRLFDIIASLILITILSPIMLLIAIVIKLDSRGPVFFRHARVGKDGVPFRHLKFRSMKPNMHEMRYKELAHLDIRKGPLVKFHDADDPRITGIGRILRKSSLDELPELFLVFFGAMSLVGPRPHHEEEVARYEPNQKRVLQVKPGMTGLPQVSGRANLDFDEEVQLDSYYIEHWSPWLDLSILFRTVGVVFNKTGAY